MGRTMARRVEVATEEEATKWNEAEETNDGTTLRRVELHASSAIVRRSIRSTLDLRRVASRAMSETSLVTRPYVGHQFFRKG